jgi:hypothetical protein
MCVSRCCKSKVYVMFDYYICDLCGRPHHNLILKDEKKYDSGRNIQQIEEISNQA